MYQVFEPEEHLLASRTKTVHMACLMAIELGKMHELV